MSVTPDQPFALHTCTLGALPLLQHVLDKLQIDALLEAYVRPRSGRVRLSPARALGVLLRNIVLGRQPLYGLQAWASAYDPELLGLDSEAVELLNDDRVGRALEQLFDAERGALITTLVLRAIKVFAIELEQLHNDSTSLTFSGQYAQATGRTLRGRQALAITHGHNKDHRPDLKQLLWILTVSNDGGVPIHYRVCDGNITDDRTHIESWETLRRLCRRADFLYIADCKLCTREQMRYIADQGGRFITVLPRTRKEDGWFRQFIQDHTVAWREVLRAPNPRRVDGPEDVWWVSELSLCSAEGYRLVWVLSSLKAERDQQARLTALEKSYAQLEALNTRLRGKRSRFKERTQVAEAAQAVVQSTGAERWLQIEIVEREEVSYQQQSVGRPGPNTRYAKKVRRRFEVRYQPNTEAIAYEAKSDGMFPLITNCKTDELAAEAVLQKYRDQPKLEKRHEQLKTVYAVAPAFLKNEGRIEALLLLYFVALLVQALIEREVRQRMAGEGLAMLPLYPENRDCRAPTANRIFEIFQTVQRHELFRDGVLVQRFDPELTPLQQELLRLMGASPDHYRGSLERAKNNSREMTTPKCGK